MRALLVALVVDLNETGMRKGGEEVEEVAETGAGGEMCLGEAA